MKKRFKRLSCACVLCISLLQVSGNNRIFANEYEKYDIEARAVKRIFHSTVRTFLHGQPIPETVFVEFKGFKGYLGKYLEVKRPEGVVVSYNGYLYSGDTYPIPTSKIYTKRVTVHRHYGPKETMLPYVWYDDGEYRGNLHDTEMYQNKDGSWEVYYSGIVKKVPYLPSKVNKK